MSHNLNNSAREASLARRKALSTSGKTALLKASTSTHKALSATTGVSSSVVSAAMPQIVQGGNARSAALARRIAMSKGGKGAVANTDRTRNAPTTSSPVVSSQESMGGDTNQDKDCDCACKKNPERASTTMETTSSEMAVTMSSPLYQSFKKSIAMNPARAASLSRRKAMSSKGKSALKGGTVSEASAARMANPNLTSRELAQALRSQRSVKGKTGKKQISTPTGPARRRPQKENGAAQDASWKVGKSETTHGQAVTGTMVGRSHQVTGDEPSTCRSVTGTEYLGADIFRDFCQSEPFKSPLKVGVSATSHDNDVTGNKIGRGQNVTGDEPGTCQRVTGNEYVGKNHAETFCATKSEAGPLRITSAETRKGKTLTGNNVGRSGKVTGDETGSALELTGTQYMQAGNGDAPKKVGKSDTLRGGSITGTMTGRSQKMTGDEPGSCRNVTGDDYTGAEQYSSFCASTPTPEDRKVGMSATLDGETVTGTMTGRSEIVTGDEPGTCKVVTGTPYAGAEQYKSYCNADDISMVSARQRPQRGMAGAVMTGQQPGVGGKMTGTDKGVCESVSGTPYVGADQFADVCPATAAEPNSPDFPQTFAAAPWGQFSVNSPADESQVISTQNAVTGSYAGNGHITGPFGMATGKVTGTEDARFGKAGQQTAMSTDSIPDTAEMIAGRVKSRISGEGMSVGMKITGDDWDRGDNVTGTEGLSAAMRNPTIRSTVPTAMSMMTSAKRNDEMVVPVSKVTGGSGNTEQGALITYSGGARG